MRKLLFLTSILILAWASVASATIGPQVMIIEDFESYSNGAALRSEWTVYGSSEPTSQELSSVAHNGSQAMELGYDLDLGTTEAWVSHNLPAEADWTGMTSLTVWYQGIEGNSPDHISLLVLEEEGGPFDKPLIAIHIEGGAAHTGWNRWDVSLLDLDDEQLQRVNGIAIGAELRGSIVDPDEENTAGTLYFDDISVTNGLETVWIGTTDAWGESRNWTSGLPTDLTDARIPSVLPTGSVMPIIRAEGATAHDLAIEQGATVNLNSFDLAITGTLDNAGSLIDVKVIGGTAEESFLAAGGHPGLTIATGTETDNSVARANDELGETTVTIKAGQSCTSSDSTVQRCYNIVPAQAGTSTITFYFSAEDLIVADDQPELDCSNLTLYNYHENTWSEVAGPDDENIVYQCDTANFSITVSGIREYSPFVLSDAEPVAITLQSFNVSPTTPMSMITVAVGLLALLAISSLILLRRS